jgi:hypothetical protein
MTVQSKDPKCKHWDRLRVTDLIHNINMKSRDEINQSAVADATAEKIHHPSSIGSFEKVKGAVCI